MTQFLGFSVQRAGARVRRVAAAALLAGFTLAVVGCEAVPTGASPQPRPPAPGAAQAPQPPPEQPGQPGQPGQAAPSGRSDAAGEVAAEPDRSIALLGTRQLRCAGPRPPGRDPERPGGDGFRDEAQWRAHLASIDPGTRVALESFGIDFKAGQSAALVRPGALPNLGYRISIPRSSLPVSAGILEVQVVVEPPPPNLLQAQVIAFPCIYLRLAASDYDRIEVAVERRPAP
jgi:hypothetical protein